MDIIRILEGTECEAPIEFVMYKLCEKFGWTEKDILESSYQFIASILQIMKIEIEYKNWKSQKV